MKLEIIGRGPWGDTYARTLSEMGVDYWQVKRNWSARKADGLIIATPADTHYSIAADAIQRGIPVIIEKPVCLTANDVTELYRLALQEERAIVFTGHTRLYSPAWREFKAKAGKVDTLFMQAGGPAPLGWLWDWGPHLVAMCLDLGFDPLQAHMIEMADRSPIRVTVNGNMTFVDGPTEPTALEVLITEFCAAIEKGEPNLDGLRLGVKVVEALEQMEIREEFIGAL